MSDSTKKPLSPHEIERWTPPSLRYVVGCSDLKEHFADMLRAEGFGPNTLILGPPGTGKTAAVHAYLRTLTCPNRNPATLDTCGQCHSCKQFDPRYAETRIFADMSPRVSKKIGPVNYVPMVCSTITEEDFRKLLADMGNWHGMTVVYLDDLDLAEKRGLGDLLLKPLDELGAVWIATASSASVLSKPLLHRFAAILSTSPASQEDFVQFLQERCQEWGLNHHDRESLILLAQRSKLNPRVAIQFLAVAAMTKEDRDAIRKRLEHRFPKHDETGEDPAAPGAGPSEPNE